MDSLTHIVIGAAVGLSVRNRHFNRKAAAGIGALACTAPDFDVFIRSSDNPLLLEEFHRSFSHALIFIPFGALLIAGILLALFKRLRPDWRQVILIAVVAYATHGLLDACTSYGTQLLWPFSHERVSWDIISIVDPAFTLPLLIGMAWSYRNGRYGPARLALLYGLLHLGFCYAQHYRAMSLQTQLIAQRQQVASSARATPGFGSQYNWNSLYISRDRVYLDTIHTPLFAHSYVDRTGFSVPLYQSRDLPARLCTNAEAYRDFGIFHWFAQGYLTAVREQPLTIVDLRYVQKSTPPLAMWGIRFTETPQGYLIEKQGAIVITP